MRFEGLQRVDQFFTIIYNVDKAFFNSKRQRCRVDVLPSVKLVIFCLKGGGSGTDEASERDQGCTESVARHIRHLHSPKSI